MMSPSMALPRMPPELADALAGEVTGKRNRTRLQLLLASLQVFMARGVALASLQEIAVAAGVANGTIYTHFEGKDDVVRCAAVWVAHVFCERIGHSYRDVSDGAERMAIGLRRYMWLAESSPSWALLLLDLGLAAPAQFASVARYPLADLRLGIRQHRFRVASEAAAMDLVAGTLSQGMRSIASGSAPRAHSVALTTTVLCGLGMPHAEAAVVARLRLPPL